eukprot:CAMPEP_0118646996 /NCGR_PEP_ID=MMETSP0785-20121206/8368_1 /TAXON_ID=91992 /ORGANISM="Bolidomonas pacifica, Strain CCMP 1866" /LENGTH=258 /DNA_ID=CAMNT_0006539055 /DNA_START=2276 /DNA_END=3056 /DNA_ORIENTATION=-
MSRDVKTPSQSPLLSYHNALNSLVFDSSLFDGNELFPNNCDQQQTFKRQQRLRHQYQTSPAPMAESLSYDYDHYEKQNKVREQMTKKKNREKQRRQDINSAFAELVKLLDEISPLPQKSPKTTIRLEVIQRTIKVIEQLRDECESNKRRRFEPSEMTASLNMMPPFVPLQPDCPFHRTSSMPMAPEAGAPQHSLMMVLPVFPPTAQAPMSCVVYPIPTQVNSQQQRSAIQERSGFDGIDVEEVGADEVVGRFGLENVA